MTTISTIEARCKDCYKCLRSCPVKAIRFVEGATKSELHAKVMSERCILDGRCVLECPQKAKRVRSDLQRVRNLIDEGRTLIASLAPSYVGAFFPDRQGRVVAALRELGFYRVEETAFGAELVTAAHLATLDGGGASLPVITSACPVVVNLVEMYYPELIPHMAPVVSPMLAHAMYLKAQYPKAAVVFVGPCFAKKDEGTKSGVVDAVLTFRELLEWAQSEGISMESLSESEPDGKLGRIATLFPADGGLLKTASMPTDILAEEVTVVSGVDNCQAFLQRLKDSPESANSLRMVEMLACQGGCIFGPGLVGCGDPALRRRALLSYYRARAENPRCASREDVTLALASLDLRRGYADRKPDTLVPDEVTIRAILAQTGKFSPEDELNCGACGYSSCREKATAVYHGFAEIQMCMPYMRDRAESMSNVIIASIPNAVIVVGKDLTIVEMNRAAEQMFGVSPMKLSGQALSTLIDPSNFEKVLETRKLLKVRVAYPQYGLVTEQSIFYVDKENVVVGVFEDVTHEERRKEEVARLKQSAVQRAQEVINKQMKVAQEVAGLLGETTADTKVLLTRLIELMQKD